MRRKKSMIEKTKMRTFNMNISAELSNDLEREYRIINNNTRNAAWLMSDDVRLSNKKIQNYLNLVAEGLHNYDRLKDKVSNEYAIPEASNRWGNVALEWNLQFNTAVLTVTETGPAAETIENTFSIDDETVSKLKDLAVKTDVYRQLDSYLAKSFENVDNSAIREFISIKNETEDEYERLKTKISDEIVIPILNQNSISSVVEWSVDFSTKIGTITIHK